MNMLRSFLDNHVLANLAFGLVLVVGLMAYMDMPRSRDPDINFNWIEINTALPGASSIEVEKRITDPIEDSISSSLRDLRFVSSTSREGSSSILVRFDQLSDADFRERVADLRREVQNVYTSELPTEATDPIIREITTSSGFPTAMLVLFSPSPDDNFRRYAANMKLALERLAGVDQVLQQGIGEPELHIVFDPDRLQSLGLNPDDLAKTIQAYFTDVSVGDLETRDGRWLVRLEGTNSSLEALEAYPIVTRQGLVALGKIAEVYRSTSEPTNMVQYQGQSAVLFNVTKQEGANTLAILENLDTYIAAEQKVLRPLGYQLKLVDDQTVSTKEAISLMQRNAAIGLALVMFTVFVFLGGPIALLTGIGIPFTLAATFFILHSMGMSLNNSVLLGIVVALGMLVDDAVVVVETIYYRLQQGAKAMDAGIAALKEVAAPVFTSVLTTVSVFLPLMLLPGIMGEFMRVIPMVVCIGLAVSLIEAFWMLPAHVALLKVNFDKTSNLQRRRRNFTRAIRHRYSLILLSAMRRPWLTLIAVTASFFIAIALVATKVIPFNFFASDPLRIIYVNVELPPHKTLQDSLAVAVQAEEKALGVLAPEEVNSSLSYSGMKFSNTEAFFGENYAQAVISLAPTQSGMRDTRAALTAVEAALQQIDRAQGTEISAIVLEDGPPLGQAISVKVRGDTFVEIESAANALADFLRQQAGIKNIGTDFKIGSRQLRLSLDGDAIQRAGIAPQVVTLALQSRVDGLLLGQYQNLGEEVKVRLLSGEPESSLEALLNTSLSTSSGHRVRLGNLVKAEYGNGYQDIRHYNFKRTVTLGADVDDDQINAVDANQLIKDHWEQIKAEYPGVSLDFSGLLDDIEENLSSIGMLFAVGIGLIYMILGTQFKSYLQPVIILLSVPLALTGVIYGLAITGNPLSFSSMYGVVALSGISVNSAIVLISAANSRLQSGMSPLHATVYAGRRRVVPILITSITTIAGLFSLAAGIGGKSLMWGPIATAIVSGLLFSTLLVLVVIPLIYYQSIRRRSKAFGSQPL